MSKRAISPVIMATIMSGVATASPAGAGPFRSIEPHFVALDDIVVPIIDGNTVTGRMRFKPIIAASSEAGMARLGAIKPRLRSESLVAGLEFSRLHASGLRPVNAAALARMLTSSLKSANPDINIVLLVKSSADMG